MIDRLLRRRRSQRGAVLVETAMVLPFLMVIVLGVLDVGLAWRASMTVTSATRAGARVASNMGIDWDADRQTLLAIGAGLGRIPASQIERVVIYRSTSADGAVPAACLTATALSSGGNASARCNVYRGSDVANVASLSFPTSCSGRHQFYCPSSRVNSQATSTGLDFIGVYIVNQHPTMTKMFGATMDIKDTTVMRIEPNAGNPS